jgi:two-component system sensor histidine kinase CpxA
MDRIDLEIQRLEQLISQLLSLMRLEAGADPPARTEVDLAVLLNGVARDAAFEAESCRRRVVVTKAIPCTVVGDPALLRSALENLVRNGVRHSAENTVVELSLDRDPNDRDRVLVQVRDHGAGVPPGDLSRLFDPFFRVEAARDRGSGGYGLGLTIADRAVRLHGGNIVARNADGGGLLVVVRIPAPTNGARDGAAESALISGNRG